MQNLGNRRRRAIRSAAVPSEMRLERARLTGERIAEEIKELMEDE